MPEIRKVSRLKEVPGIGVDRMGNAADATRDSSVLRLENLDTDIPPPRIAIEVTKRSIGVDEHNSYLPFLGQNELRKGVIQRILEVSGIEYDWQSECVISAGGMSGILNVFLATLEPGDEVIVTDPVYAGIINRIRLAGGIPRFVPLIPSPTGWHLDLEALAKCVSSKTRMIVMSPGMPTGHVFTEKEWQVVCSLAVEIDAWLLYDAAMERILYDGRVVIHPASFPNMRERTITVGAASKEFRMIGWRIGWIVAPSSIMNEIALVSISNVVCQTGISMAGVAAALNTKDDGLKEALSIWQERRDILLRELEGLPVIPPHGGWSFLMDTSSFSLTSVELSEKLLHEAKVATTPMVGWGETADKYIRFVFSNEPKERLIGVGKRISRVLTR